MIIHAQKRSQTAIRSVFRFLALSCILSVCMQTYALCAENPPGLPFLRLGMDAQGSSLGGAMTATGHGITALHWNPAGLVIGTNNEIMISHRRGFEDIDSEFIALLIKNGTRRAFAISAFSNNIGGIEQRSRPTLTPNGIISAHDFYAGVTYSQVINNRIQVGATVKYLYQKIFFDSASGYAGDIGIRYDYAEKHLEFGAVLQNIGTMEAFIHDKPTMPTLVRAGTAYTLPVFLNNQHEITVSGEYELLFEGNNSARFGIEYRYGSKYSLRAGYLTGFEERDLGMGAGINIERLGLDYAFSPDVTSFGNQHIFSLRLKI